MREIIRPGAFTKALRNASVAALFNHDPNIILGHTKNRTLELEQDAIGLKVRMFPPDTIEANDKLQLIRGGYVDQMSFAFSIRPEGEHWDWKGEERIREIIEVEELFDVSPVLEPAYPQTDVHARNYDVQARSYCEARIKELDAPPVQKVTDRRAFFDKYPPINFLTRVKSDYRL